MQEESRTLQERDVFSKGRVTQNAPFANGSGSEGGVILGGAEYFCPSCPVPRGRSATVGRLSKNRIKKSNFPKTVSSP